MSTARNITRTTGHVSRDQREARLGQRGAVVWLTGLSGSGKSTIAWELDRRLNTMGRATYVLDGDNVRHGLNKDLGFSPEARAENIRRVGEVAALFADAGLITITAFISPYCDGRDAVRRMCGDGRFFEIHLDVSVDVCEERDPKGLYARARAGEIPDFTGISAPYELPPTPELTLDTHAHDVSQCVDRIVACLGERGIMSAS